MERIVVAAVALLDADGRMVTVRKRGTSCFMNPGGKPEPGEQARDTAVREIAEELGVTLQPELLTPLGTWEAPAANEPDTVVVAHAFVAALPAGAEPRASAEIEEVRLVHPREVTEVADYAPLLVERFVPVLLARGTTNSAEGR